jgi:hypothetical protein
MVNIILFINLYVLMGWLGYEIYLLNKNNSKMVILEKDYQDVKWEVVEKDYIKKEYTTNAPPL